jgi:hypothetical protein
MKKLTEITPIGEFILQSDAKAMMTQHGAYYHYADVCILLKGFAEKELEKELERLYALDCHSEYLREAIKERIEDIRNPQDWI